MSRCRPSEDAVYGVWQKGHVLSFGAFVAEEVAVGAGVDDSCETGVEELGNACSDMLQLIKAERTRRRGQNCTIEASMRWRGVVKERLVLEGELKDVECNILH